MDLDKRGRGRGRGSRGPRGRGRGGRGRGRGKKAAAVVSSDEEISLDQTFDAVSSAPTEDGEVLLSSAGNPSHDIAESILYDSNKESEFETKNMDDIDTKLSTTVISTEEQQVVCAAGNALPIPVSKPTPKVQQLDMEADISQLEAPTFTTISRGPPEPMLRLKWNHKVSLIGEKVLNPMIHCCDQCEKPILVYGRMIPCKHVFCLKCARAEPIKICPRCNDKVVRVEQSGLGTVFMCTHGGSRYGNTGCRRTYLSQRDLQAHINHRHVTQPLPSAIPTTTQVNNDIKNEGTVETHKSLVNTQRKVSESASNATIQVPSTLLTQRTRTCSNIGTIPPPGASVASATSAQSAHSALTQANLARINNANAQDCHQGKVALHHTLKKTPITQSHNQLPETVADASYYSNVLNSFGSAGGVNNSNTSNNSVNPNSAAAVGYGFDSPSQPKIPSQSYQYYR